jgi:hypothetical protein
MTIARSSYLIVGYVLTCAVILATVSLPSLTLRVALGVVPEKATSAHCSPSPPKFFALLEVAEK